ncbi:diacylglycerol kinase [Streptomyces liangshanensis]|uniref:Diacylglycerol kinase n=1 Tax=Streptomyces liangshanensis TaxID=2717324 RepID=A0A6G9GZ60_9ACTN|nr:diacylglycerol kinase [Streptomyces liangshanensis]QIQ03558.1 diacylglycerol kinase [Streptomyces liangshanensis]
MSAPGPAENGAQQLLVVIDPVARRTDGESVRIAKDVLSAGAAVKICLPEGPEEFARALARRGGRRPVVIGDDRALLRTVALLHRERELSSGALSLVPVGASVELARALGVPTGAVAAARAVLDGVVRRLDLLVDESDGVVLGDLHIPGVGGGGSGWSGSSGSGSGSSGSGSGSSGSSGSSGDGSDGGRQRNGHGNGAGSESGSGSGSGPGNRPGSGPGNGSGNGPGSAGGAHGAAAMWNTCRSLVRTLVRPPSGAYPAHTYRLRVEADGVLLSDLDEPVEGILVRSRGGRAEVVIRTRASAEPVRASALSVTVSGADFRYRADARVTGPVRTRTWTLRAGAWGLTLPTTYSVPGASGTR